MARASRDARRAALRAAELVVCTLSAAGGDLAALRRQQKGKGGLGTAVGGQDIVFDAVIVDEAAQAIEPASLIPLYALEPTKVSCRVLSSAVLSRVRLVGRSGLQAAPVR